ncbi:MAG TPA: hypothetical protein VFK38_02765 [Candidatus Limnocylindrales bacterium]|nr:hypothetical protein [Candidatus Limnocylindrales bacterium]
MASSVLVPLTAPLDVPGSIEPFRRWGDDLLDRWDGQRLLRTVRLAGRTIAVAAESAGSLDRPALRVWAAEVADAPAAGAALARTFVVAPASFAGLLGRDPVVADLERAHPGLRPVLVPDLFTALVRSISAQQVNLSWAATTRRRLAGAFGERHAVGGGEVWSIAAERLATASPEEIRALQFTNAKARAIVAAAQALASGAVSQAELASLPDEAVIDRLVALPGVGRWTAEWILARTFGRPRVVAGDLGVRKAVARAYLGRDIASQDEVRSATAHWGESAAVAQALLLRSLVAEPPGDAP